MFLPSVPSLCRFYMGLISSCRYVGSISGLAYIFALPCIVYLLIEQKKKSLSWGKVILHGGLVLFGFLNLISQFLIK